MGDDAVLGLTDNHLPGRRHLESLEELDAYLLDIEAALLGLLAEDFHGVGANLSALNLVPYNGEVGLDVGQATEQRYLLADLFPAFGGSRGGGSNRAGLGLVVLEDTAGKDEGLHGGSNVLSGTVGGLGIYGSVHDEHTDVLGTLGGLDSPAVAGAQGLEETTVDILLEIEVIHVAGELLALSSEVLAMPGNGEAFVAIASVDLGDHNGEMGAHILAEAERRHVPVAVAAPLRAGAATGGHRLGLGEEGRLGACENDIAPAETLLECSMERIILEDSLDFLLEQVVVDLNVRNTHEASTLDEVELFHAHVAEESIDALSGKGRKKDGHF